MINDHFTSSRIQKQLQRVPLYSVIERRRVNMYLTLEHITELVESLPGPNWVFDILTDTRQMSCVPDEAPVVGRVRDAIFTITRLSSINQCFICHVPIDWLLKLIRDLKTQTLES